MLSTSAFEFNLSLDYEAQGVIPMQTGSVYLRGRAVQVDSVTTLFSIAHGFSA
jgi:hypothetical protein